VDYCLFFHSIETTNLSVLLQILKPILNNTKPATREPPMRSKTAKEQRTHTPAFVMMETESTKVLPEKPEKTFTRFIPKLDGINYFSTLLGKKLSKKLQKDALKNFLI